MILEELDINGTKGTIMIQFAKKSIQINQIQGHCTVESDLYLS